MLGNEAMNRTLARVLTGSVFCLVASGCGMGGPKEAAPSATAVAMPAKPRRVELSTATLLKTVEEPGRVSPREESVLQARIPGQVSEVLVDIGSFVKGPSGKEPGSLLARLDAPELVAEHLQRQSEVRLAAAELDQSRKALASARAAQAAVAAMAKETTTVLKRTESNMERWRAENKRIASLVRDRVVDQQTSDEIANQMRAAEAHHEEALAKVETAIRARDRADAESALAEGALGAAAARLDVSKAAEVRVATLMEFRAIRAPFDGVVTKRVCDPGEVLEAGHSSPLFTVARIDPVRAVAYLPETLSGRLPEGARVTVRFPGMGLAEIMAPVSRTGWALDDASRTLRVEADIANPSPHPVRAGAYIRMSLPLAWKDVRVLPKSAVIRQQDQSVAFIAREGKVRRVIVETGGADDKLVEIRSANLGGEALDLSKAISFLDPAAGRTEGDLISE